MTAATVTSKGQITIPADIRSAHGLEPGHKLIFFTRLDGSLGVRISKPAVGSGFGALAHLAQSLSLEEMRDAIGDAAAAETAEGLANSEEVGAKAGGPERAR